MERVTSSRSFKNSAITLGIREVAKPGRAAMRKCPAFWFRISSDRREICSKFETALSTSSERNFASCVGCSRPLRLSKRGIPMDFSKLEIRRLTAGCEMPSMSAAAVTPPVEITARKASNCRRRIIVIKPLKTSSHNTMLCHHCPALSITKKNEGETATCRDCH